MNKTGAIVVGDQQEQARAVFDIAADLDFAFVKPWINKSMLSAAAPPVLVCFVLFAEVPDPEVYGQIIRDIRRGQPRSFAFSPLIYFCESPPREMVMACSRLGFDDVVTMPFTRERVRARLMRQIETPQIYFETEDYFGPDRRRLSNPRLADAYLRGLRSVKPARRYEIRRSLNHGVMILHEEMIGAERSLA